MLYHLPLLRQKDLKSKTKFLIKNINMILKLLYTEFYILLTVHPEAILDLQPT
jgi:hypothetical protein